jgi:uncharacterized damage-inducible protein DinB
MTTHLADLMRYNAWATAALLDFCRRLPEHQLELAAPGTYGAIGATLLHVAAAEERYAARIAGEPGPGPDFLSDEAPFPGLQAIAEHTGRSGLRLAELAGSLPDGEILRGSWRGKRYEMPAAALFAQVLNHGDEHRGHVGTVLGANGIEPPEIDGWAWAEQALGARYE